MMMHGLANFKFKKNSVFDRTEEIICFKNPFFGTERMLSSPEACVMPRWNVLLFVWCSVQEIMYWSAPEL